MNFFNKKQNQQGFTLVELMIVIAIIGILAAIAVPNFMAYQKKGYESAAKTQARNYYTAVQAYLTDPNIDKYEVPLNFLPPGFAKDDKVAMTGTAFSYDTTKSLITGGPMSFKHARGDISWWVDSNGKVAK